ncbi:Uncharacterised protein (plasmid) [Tsukamurella tyrosinosolvens]|uniref:Uncharacterized protein n=1 Tax=Tsukamurella tyrosinosolvens TaxID=57704 RepID=A0A1H4UGS2_TSUTY|nr:hypothetical protein [Tsukamurella tyrosinosolvens]KXO92933.1 hypothetical protein AXK58_13765 [Tsukamurella tyrosinosolvens]SEC67481.1 hypothetical protein SAMN04489793_2884 [Tsukamurella tyrosinosolvens]VEH94189.1 Uncharacterised protein [Tsukamurella tyrosinosolvens]
MSRPNTEAAPLTWYQRADDVIAAVEEMRERPWSGEEERTETQLVRYIAPRLQADEIPGLRFSTFRNGREYGAIYASGEHLFTVFVHRSSGETLFNGRRIADAHADADEESALSPYHPWIADRGRLGIGGWQRPDFEAFYLLISDLLYEANGAAPGADTLDMLEHVFWPVLEDEIWWDR